MKESKNMMFNLTISENDTVRDCHYLMWKLADLLKIEIDYVIFKPRNLSGLIQSNDLNANTLKMIMDKYFYGRYTTTTSKTFNDWSEYVGKYPVKFYNTNNLVFTIKKTKAKSKKI